MRRSAASAGLTTAGGTTTGPAGGEDRCSYRGSSLGSTATSTGGAGGAGGRGYSTNGATNGNRNNRTSSHSTSSAGYNTNAAPNAAGPAPDTTPPTRPLTLVTSATTLAFAVYDELTNAILLEECAAHGGADTERAVRGFVELTRPTLVCVGGKVAGNSGLMRLLTRGLAEADHGNNGNNSNNENGNGNGNENGNGGTQMMAENDGPAIPYKLLNLSLRFRNN